MLFLVLFLKGTRRQNLVEENYKFTI